MTSLRFTEYDILNLTAKESFKYFTSSFLNLYDYVTFMYTFCLKIIKLTPCSVL